MTKLRSRFRLEVLIKREVHIKLKRLKKIEMSGYEGRTLYKSGRDKI